MGDIEWEDGAVCFAGGKQFFGYCGETLMAEGHGGIIRLDRVVEFKDFQLNDIRTGDHIEASELDTEQKYNDAVEVFGFIHGEGATSQYSEVEGYGSLTICHDGIFATEVTPKWCARKLTYPQLMAIGKLKRAVIEREGETVCGKPKEDFEKATDKAKSLQQDFSSEQATLDCKELDINVVFTGEGVYILDCINSAEYQLESVDEYNKVVSAIRLLQSKER